jgi:peptidoglycan/xylan/chitin deacetylase (PgdA/CDA1 family)
MTIVTTSWDDGDVLDMRVADMLDAHGMKGTFYIAKDYRSARVSDADIRTLAQRHEVGAHTLTHPRLTELSRQEKEHEIVGSKVWLEEITGQSVDMFCYPGGKYDEETVDVVREAGYLGARTTTRNLSEPFDTFRSGVSLTLYPRPFTRLDYLATGYRRAINPIARLLPAALNGESWQSQEALETFTLKLFEEARARNGVFHLYGHSWANTRYGLWPVLERILERISKQPDCEYLTNAEAIRAQSTSL